MSADEKKGNHVLVHEKNGGKTCRLMRIFLLDMSVDEKNINHTCRLVRIFWRRGMVSVGT